MMTKDEKEKIKIWLHSLAHGKIDFADFYTHIKTLVYPKDNKWRRGRKK